ncbi:MAG: CBASS oligonucleotide cyclase [Pseudonocardiaceae bacterium]
MNNPQGDLQDCGYLVAKDTGELLLTSVRLHLEFVRKRKADCPDHWAQVVRLVKWWIRQHKPQEGQSRLRDGQFRFKSFMAELVCAHLLDEGLVTFNDYIGAMDGFFDWVVRTGLSERVAFTDYYAAAVLPSTWVGVIEVFDPVNPDSNVARLYDDDNRKRIVLAAEEALDAITEAGYATTKNQAVECWQVVFGDRFRG